MVFQKQGNQKQCKNLLEKDDLYKQNSDRFYVLPIYGILKMHKVLNIQKYIRNISYHYLLE